MTFRGGTSSWPVAWYASRKWLDNFAHHTEIKWHLFILSGALAMIIALITVSFQAVKAAHANPVDSIKYE